MVKPLTHHSVTGIGAAKIYLSYRDRLFTLFKPDWTYPIDYCINHIENNVAIIVANIPILRGLVTRWIFNFRTKATPIEPETRSDSNWQQWDLSSSSNGSRYVRRSRRSRMLHKLLPCIQDDFSSSLATRSSKSDRKKKTKGGATATPPSDRKPSIPEKLVTTGDTHRYPKRSYFSRSRRPSTTPLQQHDRYQASSCCEKGGDVLDTVRSVGSLESGPTLVESNKDRTSTTYRRGSDIRGSFGAPQSTWKSMELDSPPLSPSARRFSTATLHSPIAPLSPARLRGIGDEDEEAAIGGTYSFGGSFGGWAGSHNGGGAGIGYALGGAEREWHLQELQSQPPQHRRRYDDDDEEEEVERDFEKDEIFPFPRS